MDRLRHRQRASSPRPPQISAMAPARGAGHRPRSRDRRKVLGETGHNPAKAANFFKVLLEVIPPGTTGTTSLFSTHPGTRERIEKIEEAARNLPPPQQASRAGGFDIMKKYFPNRRIYRRRG